MIAAGKGMVVHDTAHAKKLLQTMPHARIIRVSQQIITDYHIQRATLHPDAGLALVLLLQCHTEAMCTVYILAVGRTFVCSIHGAYALV
jgi:hypothetical protein